MVFYTAFLFLARLVQYFIGMTGVLYLVVASITGLALLFFSIYLARTGLAQARRFMSVSIYYLFVLMILMGLNRQ